MDRASVSPHPHEGPSFCRRQTGDKQIQEQNIGQVEVSAAEKNLTGKRVREGQAEELQFDLGRPGEEAPGGRT